MNRIKKIVISVILVAVLLFVSFSSIDVKAQTLNGSSSFAEQRLQRDQNLISSLNLPKDVQYNLIKLDDNALAICFNFPQTYSQDLIMQIILKVQATIAKDKSKNIDTATMPGHSLNSTTTYCYSGSQRFAGRYNETIYNSVVGQLTSTKRFFSFLQNCDHRDFCRNNFKSRYSL